ncbi:MAG TPA: hypothetical protein RMH99_11955 [Sandaracinaceae bacterium LLY-WYZ-13_1]|nr:hypothetical protein [Sandaracinaceae bacterium LLY-WYZ-13_1]
MSTRRLGFLPALSFLLAFAGGCSASPSGPMDGGTRPVDAPPDTPDAGHPEPECDGDDDCDRGFVCAAVDSVPQCVPDPDPPPPGDGTDCSPCPSPGECREDVCVQPSESGDFCEFDPECGEGLLCIAGRCTPDPRIPTPCEADADCYAGLTCGPAMECVCTHTTDCPIGLVCEEGACVPGEGGEPCVADAECPAGSVCDAGRCRDGTVCDITHPDFAGTWDMTSELRVREALPDWLDDFLAAVEGPLRFLAGDASCIDFGLPMWVEMEICELVRPLIEEHVPSWVRPVARAIADMNDVLSTWTIEETMVLENGAVTDSYRGTHTWERITFSYRGDPIIGTPETIRGWRFSPSPFNASAVCGTFHIERHDVNVSISAIFAWVVDALVYLLTDGEHDTLGGLLADAASGFCRALGDFAEDNVDYGGVGDTVYGVCTTQIENYTNRALMELLEARIGTSPITLRGQAPVTGPNSLRPGVWDGTLYGSDFSGDFSAMR